MRKRKILVAPLNWGLGHATRCVPIIRQLEKNNFIPSIASDGAALELLRKEFPHLKTYDLPSYNITYTSSGRMLKWKLLINTPSILRTIKHEKKATKALIEAENFSGIISDSRFGVRYKHLPTVFITHQLNVLSGNTTFLSSHIHRRYISKFTECWIPDVPKKGNLSGFLGHLKYEEESVKYIGILSRFEKREMPKLYDFTIILSGPEPQRTLLETKLLEAFRKTSKRVLFIRGVIEEKEFPVENTAIEVKNYLFGRELEEALNSSEVIIGRSGYTTLLDLAKLEKRAFFIPTPGQFEQEYLAKRMMKLGWAPYCRQDDFKLSLLEQLKDYSGLKFSEFSCDFSALFSLFERK